MSKRVRVDRFFIIVSFTQGCESSPTTPREWMGGKVRTNGKESLTDEHVKR